MEEIKDFNLDVEETPMTQVQMEKPKSRRSKEKTQVNDEEKPLVNCLRNEKVIVRYIKRPSSITDPRHVCFGRMHENSTKTFTVPLLSSGTFVNVLTNSEKAFLENILGLEENALSVYRKEDNFWDDSLDNSLAKVTLKKQDNVLDLSSPQDYIRYKILLANKDLIAPSYEEYKDRPKASYLYYITSESEQSKNAIQSVGNKSNAYIRLGSIANDNPKMRMVLEIMSGRPISDKSKNDYLQVELSKHIESDAREFLRILDDEMLDTKVFIKRCHEAGLIAKKGDWYHLRSDGSRLCEMDEEPTLNIAAKYLNSVKHQELLFSLQAKLKVAEQQ